MARIRMPLTAAPQSYAIPAELYGKTITGVQANITSPLGLSDFPMLRITDRTGRVVYQAPPGIGIGIAVTSEVTWAVTGAGTYLNAGAINADVIPLAPTLLEEGDIIQILLDQAGSVINSEPILLYEG